MNYPDNLNPTAFADHVGDSPRALAWENAIDRAFIDLLFSITSDLTASNSGRTRGQDFISDLVAEQDLDGTIYAAVKAATTHLRDRKSMTAEQVGQILIDALEADLTAVAERDVDVE